MFGYRFILTSLVLSVLCFGYDNRAHAFVSWANSSGSATFFDWSGGGSQLGLFGDPILVGGQTFVFFPSGFRAESVGGGTTTVSDRLEVILTAHSGYRFTDVQISEDGDYGILGTGEVGLNGSLSAMDMTQPLSRTKSDSFVTTPDMLITTTTFDSGTWSAQAGVDLAGDTVDWTCLKLVIENELVAISQAGSTAFIEKKIVGSTLALTIVPEPAAFLFLLVGALFAVRCRRPF